MLRVLCAPAFFIEGSFRMYTLKTNASFDSAHFLAGYEGKCSNIHGHHWTVEIEVGSNSLEMGGNNRGMIVDFSKLKTDLKNIADALDHCLIVEIGSLKRRTLDVLEEEHFKVVEVMFRPTAENFAKFFYDEMKGKGGSLGNSVRSIGIAMKRIKIKRYAVFFYGFQKFPFKIRLPR